MDPQRRPLLFLTLTCLLHCGVADAESLANQDRSPLVAVFGLPSGQDARLAPVGRWQTSMTLATASHAIDERSSTESLSLDGQTSTLHLAAVIGLTQDVEIGIEMPWVRHGPGNLDSFIDTFHATFGLPEGPRARQGVDQFALRYQSGAGPDVDLVAPVTGLGDIHLHAAVSLWSGETLRTALLAGVKLPTGDATAVLGSGAADWRIGLAADLDRLPGLPHTSAYTRMHWVHLGKPTYLADRARSDALQLVAGLRHRLSRRSLSICRRSHGPRCTRRRYRTCRNQRPY